MIIEFNYEEKDFVTYQLYVASKSERIIRKRKRNKFLVPVFYIIFGFIYIYIENYLPAIIIILLGFLWYLVYPLWEKRLYIRHYKGFNKENYSKRFGIKATLEFGSEYIEAKEDGSESKVSYSEITEINEIPDLIIIKFKGG